MSVLPGFRGCAASIKLLPRSPLWVVRGPISYPARHRRHPLSDVATPRWPSQRRTISSVKMAATEATLRKFFQCPEYAVVGASTNTQKYGFKVFRWYVEHNLPVTPVNPTSKAIPVGGVDYPTVASLSELQRPTETGLSVITPPPVTLKTLQEAKELGVPAVFLQPGTYNAEVLSFAEDNFPVFVAGDGGWGSEGWCVLVDGERGMKAAGKL